MRDLIKEAFAELKAPQNETVTPRWFFEQGWISRDRAKLAKSLDESSNRFTQGYACAVAALIYSEGCHSTQVTELMKAGGLTLEACREAGVDPYDMHKLFPELKL